MQVNFSLKYIKRMTKSKETPDVHQNALVWNEGGYKKEKQCDFKIICQLIPDFINIILIPKWLDFGCFFMASSDKNINEQK